MTAAKIGSLEDIWPLQAQLNARTGFDTQALGAALTAAEDGAALPEEGGLRAEVGRALKNYIDALVAECHELQDCLCWKHWYREAREGRQHELRDLQNARVEAADMLFFWVSICQLLGLGPEDVYRLYAAKLEINHRRQDEDRSQGGHAEHEDENRAVL
jgi:NTP pyrophosphatase (non-canonical NTP hydrolase)